MPSIQCLLRDVSYSPFLFSYGIRQRLTHILKKKRRRRRQSKQASRNRAASPKPPHVPHRGNDEHKESWALIKTGVHLTPLSFHVWCLHLSASCNLGNTTEHPGWRGARPRDTSPGLAGASKLPFPALHKRVHLHGQPQCL